jgi:hypothetical protein
MIRYFYEIPVNYLTVSLMLVLIFPDLHNFDFIVCEYDVSASF